MEQTILLNDIIADGRIRADLGDIDGLCSSIREFGLIQPIVLVTEECTVEEWAKKFGTARADVNALRPSFAKLVAGGRRFTALKRLGWKELVHAKHFIWRDEKLDGNPEIALKMQAIEIEENVKRKDLTWQEQVLGRQRLLAIMQQIHGGESRSGAPTRAEKYHGEVKGFGVNKLAAMLNISAATVSRDLQIANAITKVPQLAHADTKESAARQLTTLGTIIQMQKAATIQRLDGSGEEKWKLYEGDFLGNIQQIQDESVDLVFTDLPFGVNLDKMSKHK